LVIKFKTQFKPDASAKDKQEAQAAAVKLFKHFAPLFKKYSILLRTGHIDYEDKEMKRFVANFIGDVALRMALKQEHLTAKFTVPINKAFNFIVETYGKQSEEDIMIDLQMLLLVLAKRYKQMGKNFCAYLYNCYLYEVARHIKKFTRNPANIPYRSTEYEDYMQSYQPHAITNDLEDKYYLNSNGVPDGSWITGESCSELFQRLSNEERKLVVKYYIEDYNDRQIAEMFGMHINTVNQKRRRAVFKIADTMGVDITKSKRARKSGKKIS
jgi:DNA-directed RNA polymerase specialized sigma24 family protein